MRRPNLSDFRSLYALPVRRLILPSILLAAWPALGAYPARDLVIPIAGRDQNAGGTQFLTSIWLTNADERPVATVTLSFLASGHANPAPPAMQLTLGPGATRVLDPLDATLLGSDDALGAVRIESSTNVVA